MKPLQIATQIRSWRRSKGLTQTDFGALFGVSAQAVSKWELGIACPDLSLLADLAEKMDMSVTELLYGNAGKE